MMLQWCFIDLWFVEVLADWFLGVMFAHRDIEKLTGPLDHKQVFLNFNVFNVIFNCAKANVD